MACWLQAISDAIEIDAKKNKIIFFINAYLLPANGLRYLRWGGDGEAVRPEKG